MATWIGLVVFKSISVFFLEFPLLALCEGLGVKKLASRDPPVITGLEKLMPKDYFFLACNQVVEAVALQHFVQFALDDKKVMRAPEQVSLGNTIIAIYLTVLVSDFIYYWAHRAMHLPALYPYIHKHHHRQCLPHRGYLDAANEHPLEQVIGLSTLMVAFHLVNDLSPWGLHAYGVGILFVIYGSLAFLNHTEYDVNLGPLFLYYSVSAHETHHRFGKTNYAQQIMLWDKLFGTFKEYPGGKRDGIEAREHAKMMMMKKQQEKRNEEKQEDKKQVEQEEEAQEKEKEQEKGKEEKQEEEKQEEYQMKRRLTVAS